MASSHQQQQQLRRYQRLGASSDRQAGMDAYQSLQGVAGSSHGMRPEPPSPGALMYASNPSEIAYFDEDYPAQERPTIRHSASMGDAHAASYRQYQQLPRDPASMRSIYATPSTSSGRPGGSSSAGSPYVPGSSMFQASALSKTSTSSLSTALRSSTASSPSTPSMSDPQSHDDPDDRLHPASSMGANRAPSVRSWNSDRSQQSKASRLSRATTATHRGARKSNRSRILASAGTGIHSPYSTVPLEEEIGMTALQRAQSSMSRTSMRSSLSSVSTSTSGRAAPGHGNGYSHDSPPVPGLPQHYQTQSPLTIDNGLPHRSPAAYAPSIVSSSASAASGRSRRKGSPSQQAHKSRTAIARQVDAALSTASLRPAHASSSGIGLGPSIMLDEEHLYSGPIQQPVEWSRTSLERARPRQHTRSDSYGQSENWNEADSHDEDDDFDVHGSVIRARQAAQQITASRRSVDRTASAPGGLVRGFPTGSAVGSGLGDASSANGYLSSSQASPALSAPSSTDEMRSHRGGALFQGYGPVSPGASQLSPSILSTSSLNLVPASPAARSADSSSFEARRILTPSDAGESETRFYTPPDVSYSQNGSSVSSFRSGADPSRDSERTRTAASSASSLRSHDNHPGPESVHSESGSAGLGTRPTLSAAGTRDMQREGSGSGFNAFLPLPTVMERAGSPDTKAPRDSAQHHHHSAAATISGLRSRLMSGLKASGLKKKSGSQLSHGGLTSGEATETEANSAASSTAATPLPSAAPSPRKQSEPLPAISSLTRYDGEDGTGPPGAIDSLPPRSKSLTAADRKKLAQEQQAGKSSETTPTRHEADGSARPVLPEIARATDTPIMPSLLKSDSPQSPTPGAGAGAPSTAGTLVFGAGSVFLKKMDQESDQQDDAVSPKTKPSASPLLSVIESASEGGSRVGSVTPSAGAPIKGLSIAMSGQFSPDGKLSPRQGSAQIGGVSPSDENGVALPSASSTPRRSGAASASMSPSATSDSRSPGSRSPSMGKIRPNAPPPPTQPLPPTPPTLPNASRSTATPTAGDGAVNSSPASGPPPVVPPRLRPVRNPLRGSLTPGQSGVPPFPTGSPSSPASMLDNAELKGAAQAEALAKLDPTSVSSSTAPAASAAPSVAPSAASSRPSSSKELPPPPVMASFRRSEEADRSQTRTSSNTSLYTTAMLPSTTEHSASGSASAPTTDSSRAPSLRNVIGVETDDNRMGEVKSRLAREDSINSLHHAEPGRWSEDGARPNRTGGSGAWTTGEGERALENVSRMRASDEMQAGVGDTSLSSSTHEGSMNRATLAGSLRGNASTTSLGTMRRGRLGLGTAFRQRKDRDREGSTIAERERGRMNDTDDEFGWLAAGSDLEGPSGLGSYGSNKKKNRRWPFGGNSNSGHGSAAHSDAEESDFLSRTRRKSKGENATARPQIRRIFNEGEAGFGSDSVARSGSGSGSGGQSHDTVDALPMVGSLGARSGAGVAGRHNSIGAQNAPPQSLRGHRPSLPSLRSQPAYDGYKLNFAPDSTTSFASARSGSAAAATPGEDSPGSGQRWPSMSASSVPRGSVQDHGSVSDHGFSMPGSVSMHTTTQGVLPAQASAETKRLYKRANVIRELIETERRYAADLRVVRDVYVLPARAAAGLPSVPSTPLSAGGSVSTPGGGGFGPSSILTPPILGRGNSASSMPVFMPSQISRKTSVDSTSFRGLRHSASSVGQQQQPQLAGGGAGPNGTGHGQHSNSTGSPAPAASVAPTSTDASNRSSVYTVSSQSSMTSASTAPPVPPLPASLSNGGAHGDDTQSPLLATLKSPPPVPATPLLGNAAPQSPSTTPQPPASGPVPSLQTPPLLQGLLTTPFVGSSLGVPSSLLASADAPLTSTEIRVIFANVEHCCAFAEEMVAQFDAAAEERAAEAAGEDGNAATTGSTTTSPTTSGSAAAVLGLDVGADVIGRIFLKMMPRMEQIYAHYCSKHEASMARLADVTKAGGKGAAFIRECTEAARKQTNAWDLSSLLIKPVQRVLKYPLLLRQILDATTPSQPEYSVVREALNEMIRIADHINEVKKRRDIVDEVLGNLHISNKVNSRSSSIGGTSGLGSSSKKTKKKGDKEKDKVQRSFLGSSGTSISLLVPVHEEGYRTLVSELHKLEMVLQDFPARCLSWCEALKESYQAELRLLDQWRGVYLSRQAHVVYNADAGPDSVPQVQTIALSLDPETEGRLKAYLSIVSDALGPKGGCQRIVDAVRGGIVPQTDRLLHLLINPRQVMARRDALQPEYARYRYKLRLAIDASVAAGQTRERDGKDGAISPTSVPPVDSIGQAVQMSPITGSQQGTNPANNAAGLAAVAKVSSTDGKLVEAAEAFAALHAQLLEDLPQLIYGLQLSLDALVRTFAALQERHFEERQNALARYWAKWAWNKSDLRPVTACGGRSSAPAGTPGAATSSSAPSTPASASASMSVSALGTRIDPELNVVKAYWARQRASPDVLSILEGRRLHAAAAAPDSSRPRHASLASGSAMPTLSRTQSNSNNGPLPPPPSS